MTKITRYTLEQYNRALDLKNQGLGSQRIAKVLGLERRTAVENWINKGRKPYYFSEKRILACNSIENIERIRKLNKITQPRACKISAELRTKRLSESSKKPSKELTYILGVVYGDGHVSTKQRRVILSATDKDFVLEFKKNIEKWSNFQTRFYKRDLKKPVYIKNRKSQWVCYIDSKEASVFLKNFDLKSIILLDQEFRKAFLRGIFDSEGHVSNRGDLLFYNSNKEVIDLVETLLNSLNIETILNSRYNEMLRREMYVLRIRNKSRKDYLENIGFSIKRKQERLWSYVR